MKVARFDWDEHKSLLLYQFRSGLYDPRIEGDIPCVPRWAWVAEIKASDGNPRLQLGRLKLSEFRIPICIAIVGRDSRKTIGINFGECIIEMGKTIRVDLTR